MQPKYGIKQAAVHQGLISASLHLLTVTAKKYQTYITEAPRIINPPSIMLNADANAIANDPNINRMKNAIVMITVTPQYSERVASPSNFKYFSILNLSVVQILVAF